MEGDRLRLEQALGNLVDNALRHGSGQVRLDAAARTVGSSFASATKERASRPRFSLTRSSASAGSTRVVPTFVQA